ncbi:MAG: transposase [Thermoleophilaceae bacterium]|nr:transposase [Thermoleophilaceae bacterium]
MTYARFLELFPDNAACVEYLKQRHYPDGSNCPKCGKRTKFHRIKSRAAYSCQYCRHQVYPTAGTIFHKSTVSMQLWFYAIFLMSSTRCGISAKQLEREIGVTYKTAHRMFKQIRKLLMDEDDEPLSGEVEVDETYVGGAPRGVGRRGRPGKSSKKVPVLGMVERRGRLRARVMPDAKKDTLMPHIVEHILPKSMIYTDEYAAYGSLTGAGYGHRRIAHYKKIYVDGDVTTNTIEGFFGLMKNGIRGVYHSVSTKYLQSYLDEYSFRYNRRDAAQPMFWAILDRVTQLRAA